MYLGVGRVCGGGLVSRRHPRHGFRLHRALSHTLTRYSATPLYLDQILPFSTLRRQALPKNSPPYFTQSCSGFFPLFCPTLTQISDFQRNNIACSSAKLTSCNNKKYFRFSQNKSNKSLKILFSVLFSFF